MSKIKVLFICIHNSARSQMAEAFLNHLAGDGFTAKSAGLEPGELNPLVVGSMKEVGIDISRNRTKSVFEMYEKGADFDHVIAVCDGANAERCPVFPGARRQIYWTFPDPSVLTGSKEDMRREIRIIRDQIKNSIEHWIKEITS